MKWRTASVVMGALALICFGMLFSVAYPFSTSDPHANNPADERFSPGGADEHSFEEADEYSVTGRFDYDRETQLSVETAVTDDGWRYHATTYFSGEVSSTVYHSPDGYEYERVEYEDEGAADRALERVKEDDERELLWEERDGDGVTIVTASEDGRDIADAVSNDGSFIVNPLWATEYERVEEGEGMHVYEPRDGWFGDADGLRIDGPYRVTDSSGQVRVDADTYGVESANVTMTVTEDVDTSAQYVVDTLMEDAEQFTVDVTYEFEEGDVEIDVPDWVEKAQEGQ